LLSLRDITKSFGPVQALRGVNLEIPAGQVTALVGDNGAGKSTLIKTVAGIWEPDGGTMAWNGKPVHIHSPREATALGIATVYQDLALCDNLDVVANLFLGREKLAAGLGAATRQLDEAEMERSSADLLANLAVSIPSLRREPGVRPAHVARRAAGPRRVRSSRPSGSHSGAAGSASSASSRRTRCSCGRSRPTCCRPVAATGWA